MRVFSYLCQGDNPLQLTQSAPSSVSNPNRFYGALAPIVKTDVGDNGTDTGAGARGDYNAENPVIRSAAANVNSIIVSEADAFGTATATQKLQYGYVAGSLFVNHAAGPAGSEAAFEIHSGAQGGYGPGVGWNCGLCADELLSNGLPPISAAGTFIAGTVSSLASIPVAHVIDISKFSASIDQIKGVGFSFDPTGAMFIGTNKFYQNSPDQLTYYSSGNNQIRFTANFETFKSGLNLGWASGDPTATGIDTSLCRASAGTVQVGTSSTCNSSGTLLAAGVNTNALTATSLVGNSTAPAIASGFCTSPSISANNGTFAFTVTIGSACAGSTGTLTMPAATTGWVCDAHNTTTPASNIVEQSGGSTTTVVLQNYVRTTGVAGNFTASDVIRVKCSAY